MCYSAQVNAEFKKFVRATGSDMDIDTYVKVFWWQQGLDPRKRPKVPRGLERGIRGCATPELSEMVREWDVWGAAQHGRGIVVRRGGVADAERTLQAKETKKAREDVRIGTNKVAAAQRRLDSLKGKPG